MNDSNSESTASARSAEVVAGKNRRRARVWLAKAEALLRSEDPEILQGVDALALALYEATWHGQIVPAPDRVLIELLRLGWKLERFTDVDGFEMGTVEDVETSLRQPKPEE